MAVLQSYSTGYCRQIAGMAQQGAGLALRRFPARAYAIAVKNRLWLWDTGYSRHFAACTSGGIFRLYPRLTPVHFEEHEALAAQLKGQGAMPPVGLILSHFHADHIAGLRDFPQVTPYCSAAAWQELRDLSGWRALRHAFIPALLPDDFAKRVRFVETFAQRPLPADLAPFTHGWELPESDGEVFLISLPGHARGQLGAFVRTADGWNLLAADAAWTPENYRELCEPAFLARFVMDDYPEYRQTLGRLRQLHKNGQVRILLCHEEGRDEA